MRCSDSSIFRSPQSRCAPDRSGFGVHDPVAPLVLGLVESLVGGPQGALIVGVTAVEGQAGADGEAGRLLLAGNPEGLGRAPASQVPCGLELRIRGGCPLTTPVLPTHSEV